MWENSIWMTPYFSSKFRILDISENILFLLDILAIIRFLFHQCSPIIKRAIILISYFDLLILKHAIQLKQLCNFTDTMGVYFYTLHKISSKSVQWFLNDMHSKYQSCIASSSRHLHWITPIFYQHMPQDHLYLWSKYRRKRLSSFPVIAFLVN